MILIKSNPTGKNLKLVTSKRIFSWIGFYYHRISVSYLFLSLTGLLISVLLYKEGEQDTDDGHCHVQEKDHSRSAASANFGNVSRKA